MVDYLLQHGRADAARVDGFGVAALHRAVGHRRLRAASRLLADAATDASQRTVAPTVPEAYEADATRIGQTPLHLARGDAALTRVLLRFGADCGAADAQGDTPLHAAAREGSAALEAVRMLLRAGADANARNARGQRAADVLPEGCSQTLPDELLEAEAQSRASAARR